jgi:hypothetical protein
MYQILHTYWKICLKQIEIKNIIKNIVETTSSLSWRRLVVIVGVVVAAAHGLVEDLNAEVAWKMSLWKKMAGACLLIKGRSIGYWRVERNVGIDGRQAARLEYVHLIDSGRRLLGCYHAGLKYKRADTRLSAPTQRFPKFGERMRRGGRVDPFVWSVCGLSGRPRGPKRKAHDRVYRPAGRCPHCCHSLPE